MHPQEISRCGGHLKCRNSTSGFRVANVNLSNHQIRVIQQNMSGSHSVQMFRLFWKKIDGTHSKPNFNEMSFGTFWSQKDISVKVQFGLECVSKKIVFKSNKVSIHWGDIDIFCGSTRVWQLVNPTTYCGFATFSPGVHQAEDLEAKFFLLKTKRVCHPIRCKTNSVGQSTGLSIPKSSVRFRQNPQKTRNSNLHGIQQHRPSRKGTKLPFKGIKAIINQ